MPANIFDPASAQRIAYSVADLDAQIAGRALTALQRRARVERGDFPGPLIWAGPGRLIVAAVDVTAWFARRAAAAAADVERRKRQTAPAVKARAAKRAAAKAAGLPDKATLAMHKANAERHAAGAPVLS